MLESIIFKTVLIGKFFCYGPILLVDGGNPYFEFFEHTGCFWMF